jgi:hypothetical protein
MTELLEIRNLKIKIPTKVTLVAERFTEKKNTTRKKATTFMKIEFLLFSTAKW